MELLQFLSIFHPLWSNILLQKMVPNIRNGFPHGKTACLHQASCGFWVMGQETLCQMKQSTRSCPWSEFQGRELGPRLGGQMEGSMLQGLETVHDGRIAIHIPGRPTE